ncbi:DUF1150 family protein [Rhodospira trueperi]|uniref:DUF1150 family protein n=1 Tax=Rhodospira trueperi TaxID=69960 RepID=A0A1G7DUN0_9PROT|nr:DUF1150 family protein [Rhodospira trueperi]SDE55183.1 hypothetical protein SAMN05421720_10835 [Rhodospira trueperi]
MTDDHDLFHSGVYVDDDDDSETDGAVGDMTPRDFARLGLNHIAYVRAVESDDDGSGWGIFAANGRRIGMASTCELAFAATRQHDMVPFSVH